VYLVIENQHYLIENFTYQVKNLSRLRRIRGESFPVRLFFTVIPVSKGVLSCLTALCSSLSPIVSVLRLLLLPARATISRGRKCSHERREGEHRKEEPGASHTRLGHRMVLRLIPRTAKSCGGKRKTRSISGMWPALSNPMKDRRCEYLLSVCTSLGLRVRAGGSNRWVPCWLT